uniref:Ectonucleoside triphosphate diphosphohydrolase 8 n=1 Tax=Chelonoidis abingdonii TaxID=106734 RepID=A0A8C0H722_CHEAB
MSIDLRRYIPAILVALAVFCSGLPDPSCFGYAFQYGMVFDAGSSHTSLFVYQWTSDKTNDTGVVSQTLSCNVKGPGISSYANDPPKAGVSLRSCLEEALKVIPDERQREVPVYLGATAGMRLLSMENKSAADQVLNEVTKTLQQYPVNFHGARIITGEEEGAYGWITINYLLDSFTKYSPKQRDWIHPQSAKILGALDLGGASTQISFIPIGPITDQTKASTFRLYGFTYTIYTHSYLCYGQNQALKQLILKITEGSVNHPCYPEGYQETTTAASIHSMPCTASQAWTPSQASWNATLVGTGNATECRMAIKQIFNFTACGQSQSCTFDGIYQPLVNGEFFAFSAFYYTFSFLNLTRGQPLDVVEDTVQKFCARNWTDVRTVRGDEGYSGIGRGHLWGLQSKGPKRAGGRELSQGRPHSKRQAANTDIGWTLGYMLNLTNKIPAEAPEQVKGQQHGLWAAAIFFIVLTLAVCLIGLLIYILW